MASKAANVNLEEDLTCSICYEIFTDPVTLQCGHNFCKKCVCEYWKQSCTRSCSICRAPSTTDLKINIILHSITDALKEKSEAQPEGICSEHEEKLKLFCLEDQELICVICQTSKKHQNHKCCPIKEAALDYKEEVNPAVMHLPGIQEKLSKVKEEYRKHLNHIQDQTEKTEKQIKEDFVKLHQFLNEEEKNLLADLKKEKNEKEQKMRENIKSISKEITSLSINIKEIEKKMDQGDILFLMEGCKLRWVKVDTIILYKLHPQIESSNLISCWIFIGSSFNLSFSIWLILPTGMYSFLTVTLDPNTANPYLTLSEDLTAVTMGSTWRYNLPDNPERFDVYPNVLGSEGFTSGRHSWVVDVGNKTKWDLGVTRESANRKGENVYLSPKHGYWTVTLRDGGKYNAGTDRWTRLELEKRPKKVLVCVDYEAGKVSFSNADDMTHIYTFTDNFTEKLFP
uniref:Tripartite motif containing 35 n=1 Tax=Latimeria chalumnae TaxID=7897 RepID=H2ZTA6_LATCH